MLNRVKFTLTSKDLASPSHSLYNEIKIVIT
jgi:hypothetical protein